MKKTFLLCHLLLLIFCYSTAQSVIRIPLFKDKYSEFVKKLESGQSDINYREFRESFIKSGQYKVAAAKAKEYDSLKQEMFAQKEKGNYRQIIILAKDMLSINYTSMFAHKILQQTYSILGDTINKKKYHDIEFGLIGSILRGKDGKSCNTAWQVVQVEEEYFILDLIGVKLINQTIDRTDGLCDKMEVNSKTGRKIYYFDISKVFEGYKKSGIE